jgi:ABC-2 type transport system permease protein
MRNIYLVARRDYLGYVSAWGFWLGMLLTPIIIVASMTIPSLLRENQPIRYFAVIDTDGDFTAALDRDLTNSRVNSVVAQLAQLSASPPEGFDPQSLQRFRAGIQGGMTPEDALAQAAPGVSVLVPEPDFVRVDPPSTDPVALAPYLRGDALLPGSEERELFAVIIREPDGSAITYLSEDVVNSGLKSAARRASQDLARRQLLGTVGLDPTMLAQAEASAPPIRDQKPGATGEARGVTVADRAPYIAAMVIAFVLWFLIFSVVNYLITGTIEERSNKIFDTLLTSVRLNELLAGKLLAVLALALTLMGTWALMGYGAASLFGGGVPANVAQFLGAVGDVLFKPGVIVPTVLSFVLGYLIYGSIFLAIGSLCDSLQEAQTLMSPMLILLMIPLFLLTLAVTDPKSTLLAAASWVPVFTPFLLILRLPNELPLAEVAGLIGLMAVTTALVLWGASKVYRAGAVHGAGTDSVARMLRGLVGLKPRKVEG